MQLEFVHDMIHNNPGLAKYETQYNDPVFLKKRGYEGKVFDLFECAQYALDFHKLDEAHPERASVFPEGDIQHRWIVEKANALKEEYLSMVQNGINVYFMMDMIVLPNRIIEIYPEILNEEGIIDIQKPQTIEIMKILFQEMFEKFPEIDGIYIRYGETYVGEKYFIPYHSGNNPILNPELSYHMFLIRFLQDEVCRKYQKKIFYRTWGFGAFQYDPELYESISDMIETHPLFYFCIKHTQGDFHRTFPFNRCLNIGKHQQVVEVQAAREYEGKGAHPNYIAGGVINGFEELDWLMESGQNKCLKDVCLNEDSLVKGIWIWSRGGGWAGPYINGANDRDGKITVESGSELWADINAYVLAKWAKDMFRSDKEYVIQYSKEELSMGEEDAELFYEILALSEKAVLLGRGTGIPSLKWDVFWTRDQNIQFEKLMDNLKNAIESGCLGRLLEEKVQSVQIWKEIVSKAKRLSDEVPMKDYIVTTCEYGAYLYAIYETMYRGNAMALMGNMEAVAEAVREYDDLWVEWQELYQTRQGCPTLYEKENAYLDMGAYHSNKGFDSAMCDLRTMANCKKEIKE